MILYVKCLSRLDLGPVASHEYHACHECSKDLGEDIVRNFLQRKALPNGEADSDSRIEMPTADWGTGDDGKGDADSEGPTNLEQRTKDRDTYFSGDRVRRCQCERSYRGDTRKDVEEDTCGFSHHLTEDTWTTMLEVQLALRDRFWWYHMACNMALQGISGTKLHVMGVQATYILLLLSVIVLVFSHIDAGLLFSRDFGVVGEEGVSPAGLRKVSWEEDLRDHQGMAPFNAAHGVLASSMAQHR